MKILKVKTHPVNVPALASAAMAEDHTEVGAILDKAIEFQGMAGGLVETVDGPVFEELSRLLVAAVREAVAQAAAKAQG